LWPSRCSHSAATGPPAPADDPRKQQESRISTGANCSMALPMGVRSRAPARRRICACWTTPSCLALRLS
jgi:hypothetical protein